MKLKTHSGAKKRFKKTATGKIKRKKCGKRHLNVSKAKNRLRGLSTSAYIFAGDERRINRLLPNG